MSESVRSERDSARRRGRDEDSARRGRALLVMVFLAVPLFGQSVDEVVTLALAHSPELRALEAGVAEARANAALGNPFSPAVSLSTTPGYASGLPVAVLGQVPAIGTIEAHRLLYDPGARSEQATVTSQVDAAVAQLESKRHDVARYTAELYARLLADVAVVASSQRRLSGYETIASHTAALRKEGRARDLDLDRAELQVAAAKRRSQQAQSRLALDQLRMKTMAGVDQTIVPTASPETAEVPVTATVREDPELHALDLRIEALRTAVALANPLWQPSVAAQVQFSRLFDRFRRYYNNFKPNDLSAGVTITLPLWTGGRRAAAAARLTAQLDQLIAGREARRAQLDLANRETTSELHDAQEERVLAERTLDVARESLRVAGQLEAEGRGEVNAVPEAQIAVADAEEDLANADAQVRTVTWRLRFLQKELPHPPL